MELGSEFRSRIEEWEGLSRWERSELGKDLRRLGLSYGEIMVLIPVKKSTLATWCREVRLTEEQHVAIRTRTGSREGIPRDTNRRRRTEISLVRIDALSQTPVLMTDPLWVAGAVLYWAEGAKTRNHLKMANADPRALRLFIQWIRAYLDPDADFSLQLHLHEGNDESEARSYWRAETGLTTANFHKTFIKPKGTGHRKNHLRHGVCTVKMRRCSDAWQRTMVWIEVVADRLSLPAYRY
jgi:hypothetical protein